jgi:hypothetical protein
LYKTTFELSSEVFLLGLLLFYGRLIMCMFLGIFRLDQALLLTSLSALWAFHTNFSTGQVRLDYFFISNYGVAKSMRLDA